MDTPAPTPNQPTKAGGSVKRSRSNVRGRFAVGLGDLREFEGSAEDKRLQRLEEDAALVDRLMWAGYAGPEWTEFVKVLAGYGVQVVRSWVLSGLIFAKCRAKGVGLERNVSPRSQGEARDDAQELANETVTRAIVAFREKVLIPRKWNPTKGASVRTFFVGQCLFQFPNVYRAWLIEVQPPPVEGVPAELVLPVASDTYHAAAFALEVKSFQPTDVRAMALLEEMGYTQVEIAELLGTTWRAVESRLSRYKDKAGS